MKIKRIIDQHELEHFRKLTSRYIHVLFPLEYLNRSKVFGCYDSMKRLCGGFVLVMKGPFRVIDSIPHWSKNHYDREINKTCEVTGLWFSPSSKDRSKSYQFWFRLYLELFRTQKKYFVYAFSMSNPQIGKMYEPALPTRLFKGLTTILEGMDDVDHEVVEYVERKNLYLFPLRSPDFFTKRIRHNLFLKIRRLKLFIRKQYA